MSAAPEPLSLPTDHPAATRRPSAGVVTVSDIPGYVFAGTYSADFHVGFDTADAQSTSEILEVKFANGKIVSTSFARDWLAHVQPARDRHEQNMEAFKDASGRISVRTLRPLRKGEQLFVWYSDELARTTGIPVLTPENIKGKQRYTCTKCRESYLYPNTLKAHMRFRCPLSKTEILNSLNRSPPLPFTVFPSVSNSNTTITSLDKPSSESMSPNGLFDQSQASPRNAVNGQQEDLLSAGQHHHASSSYSSLPSSAPKLRQGSSSATISESSLQSPEMALNLSTKTSERSPSTSDKLQSTTQPIQIFNHIHPPAIPFTFDHSAFQCYCPFYPKFHDSARFCCASIPPSTPARTSHENVYFPHPCPMPFPLVQVRNLPGTVVSNPQTTVDDSLRVRDLPLKFPLPSDKAGEPLDLLPRSLYTSKSRKGHLCIYCGKLYSRKYGLKIHLRTHTGYKPLKCKVCLRPFGDPSNLNKHIRLHAEGDTPYRCEFCGKVLVRRRDLERHVKSRHPSEAEKSETRDISDVAGTVPVKVENDVVSEEDSK